MSIADKIDAQFAPKPAPPAVVPVWGKDTCEICHRVVKEGEPVLRPFSGVATYDPETGASRYLWEHQACRQGHQLAAMRSADQAVERPPHHDPVVCDLLRRVEALEGKRK